jgi:hypothetical protein
MEREDSGVIDLFAIHEKAKAASLPPPAPVLDAPSAPPPAVVTDLDDDDLDVPFAPPKSRKKQIVLGIGMGVVLLGVVLAITSFGGSEEPAKAAASKVEAAPPPPAPMPLPPPAVTADPTPPPPVTAAAPKTTAAPKPKAIARPAAAAGGMKLQKIQSAGVH